MALVAGVDIGAATAKAVLIDLRGKLVGRASIRTGADLERAGVAGLQAALEAAGAQPSGVEYIASTGYGRYQMQARDIQITEITCHARGAVELFPQTRTVIDVGAQNSRAIAVTPEGRVTKFKMSERCAAGAGRFLERVAKALELDLDELAEAAQRAAEPQAISSVCAVLAESEIINLVTEGKRVEDIVQGANESIADRVVALVRQVGVTQEVTLTGGVSQNGGTIRALSARMGVPLNASPDSPYAGALGAALLGRLRLERRMQGLTASASVGAGSARVVREERS